MSTSIRCWSLRLFAASLMLAAQSAGAEDSEGVVRLNAPRSEGVVRISDQTRTTEIVRGQSPDWATCDDGSCVSANGCDNSSGGLGSKFFRKGDRAGNGGYGANGYGANGYDANGYGYGDPYCQDGVCGDECRFSNWLRMHGAVARARHDMRSAALHDAIRRDCEEKHAWLRCKFGYFVPSGCNGKGCPPVGHYSMVYPVDPNYFDGRDGQVYAAPGYGGPVSVPLAPVVNHTFNYGWGIPSSRLTPVLHPVSQAPVAVNPSAIPSAPVAR